MDSPSSSTKKRPRKDGDEPRLTTSDEARAWGQILGTISHVVVALLATPEKRKGDDSSIVA
jgi:hypothetical protein